MVFLNFSDVDAPMHLSKPRPSAGLRMAAPLLPDGGGGHRLWMSSMKRITGPFCDASTTSDTTMDSRSSNSPGIWQPAPTAPRSSSRSRALRSGAGTSPEMMRWARPSTMAVLPTPDWPSSTGLFLVRRLRMWMRRRISSSRPTRGSNSPCLASSVTSVQKRSNALSSSSPGGGAPGGGGPTAPASAAAAAACAAACACAEAAACAACICARMRASISATPCDIASLALAAAAALSAEAALALSSAGAMVIAMPLSMAAMALRTECDDSTSATETVVPAASSSAVRALSMSL
mmetsp:Transcript_30329/g.75349  ORF Transcript_30329/g.75349 Transcript_30329/m.75349 type:complete len:292 (-) Transcript_30329:199-1074(-)